jgi:hypothetical protein
LGRNGCGYAAVFTDLGVNTDFPAAKGQQAFRAKHLWLAHKDFHCGAMGRNVPRFSQTDCIQIILKGLWETDVRRTFG